MQTTKSSFEEEKGLKHGRGGWGDGNSLEKNIEENNGKKQREKYQRNEDN